MKASYCVSSLIYARFVLFLFILSATNIKILAQEPVEYYNVINDYVSVKTPTEDSKQLYFMAGDCDLFDKRDSFLLSKVQLGSTFNYITEAKKRIELIDSLFAIFDFNYMRMQFHHFKNYRWNQFYLKNNVTIFKTQKEIKDYNATLGLSMPIFLNKEDNWAFIEDYQNSVILLLLMKKENNKWIIVEEYIEKD
jgi:hypothetical protein